MSEAIFRRVVLFGLAAAFLGAISRLAVVDLDLFHEMALVRETFQLGFFPPVDPFGYTSSAGPLSHHEWGTGLIIYLVTVQLGLGAPGLMALKYLLTAAIAVGCYYFARRQGAGYSVFAFLAWLGIGLGWGGFSTIRAQLFTLLFLVIFFFLIEADRRGKAWALWLWLPVYVIWVNLHGGFLVGLGLLAIYIAERVFLDFLAGENPLKSLLMRKRQILFWAATCLLTVCNPDGLEYFSYIRKTISLDRIPYIPEWRPLWQISWNSLLAWIISLLVILYCLTQKGLRQLPGLFIIAATAWFSLWHYRHLSLYAIAWTCYAPSYVENTALGDIINRIWRQKARLIAAIFLIIGILAASYAVQKRFWQLQIPTTAETGEPGAPVYPAGVVSYLQEHGFSGNLYVPFGIGAYVSWHLYPAVKVSMDSRFDVAYPLPVVADNIRFYAAQEGWRQIPGKYHTDAILVPRQSNVSQEMDKNGGGADWIRVYQDDGFSLYMRQGLAERFPRVDRRGEIISARFP